jgi:predicted Na+-dependent transporter
MYRKLTHNMILVVMMVGVASTPVSAIASFNGKDLGVAISCTVIGLTITYVLGCLHAKARGFSKEMENTKRLKQSLDEREERLKMLEDTLINEKRAGRR